MEIKEAGARVWPFGKWDVVFIKKSDKQLKPVERRDLPGLKEEAVDYFFKYEKSDIIEEVWIQKIGGFFDGIRFKPRPRNGEQEEGTVKTI